MADFKVGDRIWGRYEVLSLLRGGMGVVYVVRDGESGRIRAVKTFISDAFEAYEGAAERFRQEASVWIGLGKHPNIVLAEIVHQIDHRPHLFLEYVAGGDLASWIKAGRLTQTSLAVKLALDFCDGMNHAASWGMHVHRDIKPSNCLMTTEGVLKVTDFGLARALAGGTDLAMGPKAVDRTYQRSQALTRTGAAAGTPAYMAPEQFENAKKVDVMADVYSFGVMLFEMIVGETPFAAEDWIGYALAHKNEPVPNLPVATPKRLVRIIRRCLEKDPKARIGDFYELRAELDLVHEELTGRRLNEPLPRFGETATDLAHKCGSLAVLGQLDAALEAGLLAVRYDPELALAWGNLGHVHATCRRFRESSEAYERALALDPLEPAFWLGKADMLLGLGRDAEALVAQDRAIQLNPRQLTAWNSRGFTLGRLGRAAEAIASFDEALALDPNYSDAWVNRGYYLERMNRLGDALDSYRRATEINPHLRIAWNNRLILAGRLQKRDEEALAAAHVVDIPCHSAADYDERGIALGLLGRDNEALESFDKAIELDASFSDAWLNKGWRLEQMGRRHDSIACYRNAVSVDPLNDVGWNNLAHSLLALGDATEAAICFERLTQMRPQSSSAWRNLGLSFARTQRIEESLNAYGTAANLGNKLAGCEAAELLCEIGRYREAQEAAARAVQLDPDSHRCHVALGVSLMGLKRHAAALQSLEMARDLGSTRAPALIAECLSSLRRS